MLENRSSQNIGKNPKVLSRRSNSSNEQSAVDRSDVHAALAGVSSSSDNSQCVGGHGAVSKTKVARYWMLTIPHRDFVPYPVPGVSYSKGQLEKGEGGYLHWQLYSCFSKPQRLSALKKLYGESSHAEPTRSEKAEDYVWKEDTRVEGTQFEFGKKSFQRGSDSDWGAVLEAAKDCRFEDIPPDIYIRYYGSLKRISVENAQPLGFERTCTVYWGPTGTGKSRSAWAEAGLDAYPKDPCTKFWDGYRGQDCVVVDEFRGVIGISHLLRWLDRYPVLVEVKGSSTVFKATKIWITSNLHPREWYKDVDESTVLALLRRLVVIEIN